MNPWKEYERAIDNDEVDIDLFKKLLYLAKDIEDKRQELSQRIETATRVLHS